METHNDLCALLSAWEMEMEPEYNQQRTLFSCYCVLKMQNGKRYLTTKATDITIKLIYFHGFLVTVTSIYTFKYVLCILLMYFIQLLRMNYDFAQSLTSI